MPEGDTIHRAAARLSAALTGRDLVAFDAPRLVAQGPPPGTRIDGVEAKGKYLTVAFADGTRLETHLKMTGSWHLYRVGERWRKARSGARAVITTDEWVAVCFNAPHVVLHREAPGGRPGARGRSRSGADHLGPDLTAEDPDIGEIMHRLAEPDHQRRPLADVVLDQRLFCGVGNVFKSEVLHACGLHPLVPLGRVDDEQRRHLIDVAHHQLRANLDTNRRTTVPEAGVGGLAVYGRADQPCRRCGSRLVAANLGRHRRPTYWCESCQPLAVPEEP